MSITLKLLTSCLLLSLAFQPGFAAEDKAAKEKQLKSLLQKIEKLKQTIEVKEDSKSQYTKQLKSIESEIGDVSRKIQSVGKKITTRKKELDGLRKTRHKHQKQLSREHNYLAEQMYTAFTLGQQEKVKLLFSQQDPEVLQRNLVYYQYFSNARINLIEGVRHNIDKIVETESLIQQARAELENSQNSLKAEKSKLGKDRKKRESIISSLEKQLKQQGGSLVKLEDEALQLQNLIDSIQEIFIDAPEAEISSKAFAELKGKLAWPVKGTLRKMFGRLKPLSNLRWQGVVIKAPHGRQVRAVYHGRVAFSDWLRGLGNLIIIDHGNSYLSLYGHNESLFKSAGEWVEAGDVIATTGNSGGQSYSGLYFEIRKKGKPQNPTAWCKAGNDFYSG
ncbi:MAG: peptidoglycan DD-metalloendopeptidase family protein [Pseudomonadota bacterium]